MRSIFELLKPQKELPELAEECKKREEMMQEADNLTEVMKQVTKRVKNGYAHD